MIKLTKKEELAIEYHLQGDSRAEAVFKAFDCKNKESAGAYASKLFKKEQVMERLSIKQEKQDEVVLEKRVRFIDLIDKYISKDDVIRAICEGIKGTDKRVADSMIDKYLKIKGLYSPNVSLLGSLDVMLNDLREPEEPLEAISFEHKDLAAEKEEIKELREEHTKEAKEAKEEVKEEPKSNMVRQGIAFTP